MLPIEKKNKKKTKNKQLQLSKRGDNTCLTSQWEDGEF